MSAGRAAGARALRGPAPPGAIAGGVLLLALLLAAALPGLGLGLPACGFRALTGWPCPTCGSTRLLDALLRGEPLEAFLWNPLVFVAGSGVALWAALSLGRWSRGRPPRRLVLERRAWALLRLAAAAALLLGWAYLILRGV